MSITIDEAHPSDRACWENYIGHHEACNFSDSWSWRNVVERSYALPCKWFIARRRRRIEGVLALTLTRHPLFGKYLATAPFGSHGGFHSNSADASKALIDAAARVRRDLRADYVVIRGLGHRTYDFPHDWQQDTSYATYWLELPESPAALMSGLRKKTRWLVSKARRNGLYVEFGREDLLADFWNVVTRCMKELGSPFHSRSYLLNLLETFADRSLIAIAFTPEGQPAGASLTLFHRDTATMLHANVPGRYRHLHTAEFLYYSVIEECCRRGFRNFDMGRSLVGSGNDAFKMKWRPIRRKLLYAYNVAPGVHALPSLNQNNPRFKWAIRTWRRLPLWFQHLAGPRLITGLL